MDGKQIVTMALVSLVLVLCILALPSSCKGITPPPPLVLTFRP